MLVLGIECTAHTFGIGIVDCKNKKVLFNEKNQYKDDTGGGMELRKLSEFHTSNFTTILLKAKQFLKTLNKDFSDLDLISFSQGPGIGNSLKIGSLVAKTLSTQYNIPLVGVNHIKAHLEIGKMLTGFKDPMFLYVSGVNTQIIAKDDFGKYKIYGETEDIGLGNLFDSFARLAGLGFPGGPVVEQLAADSKQNYIELPYSLKGMNITLAGMYTNLKQKLESGKYELGDLCYSLQETCFAVSMEVCERAMAYTNKKEMLIVGGVAASKRLTFMAKEMCKLRGAKYDSFPMQYAMDNGAMIAWQGFVDKKKATTDITKFPIAQYINIESEI
ncbi:MAG: tRNA (adenosine(37)-N6)-threonylcarbamoyltransferase complex transferase subunit TsaD [Nanoarchaeales archaeon]|nr:tRNA (adenosine(37)-N6)-threonylcarbamoyltransferase complex transferase subunit TsaD [Nanoarchaeales archaeon]